MISADFNRFEADAQYSSGTMSSAKRVGWIMGQRATGVTDLGVSRLGF